MPSESVHFDLIHSVHLFNVKASRCRCRITIVAAFSSVQSLPLIWCGVAPGELLPLTVNGDATIFIPRTSEFLVIPYYPLRQCFKNRMIIIYLHSPLTKLTIHLIYSISLPTPSKHFKQFLKFAKIVVLKLSIMSAIAKQVYEVAGLGRFGSNRFVTILSSPCRPSSCSSTSSQYILDIYTFTSL